MGASILSDAVVLAANDLAMAAPVQWEAFTKAFQQMCGEYSRRAVESSIQDMQVVHGRAQGLLAIERDLNELHRHVSELSKRKR